VVATVYVPTSAVVPVGLATIVPRGAFTSDAGGVAMAPKNLEEAMVDRIQRALAKEMKRLRRQSRRSGNGHAISPVLARRAEVMARESVIDERRGGKV
jgi:hypothetical protein